MGIQHDSKWFNCSFDLRHSNSQSRCHHGRIQMEIAERETVWIAYQTNAFWCILHSLSSRLWSLRMKLLKSPCRKRFISLFISLFISMYFSLCFTLCFTFERDFERLHGPKTRLWSGWEVHWTAPWHGRRTTSRGDRMNRTEWTEFKWCGLPGWPQMLCVAKVHGKCKAKRHFLRQVGSFCGVFQILLDIFQSCHGMS